MLGCPSPQSFQKYQTQIPCERTESQRRRDQRKPKIQKEPTYKYFIETKAQEP
jgi:hypothetical protein